MPTEQHDIFAPWDGDVIQVLVKNGDAVKQGDVWEFIIRRVWW